MGRSNKIKTFSIITIVLIFLSPSFFIFNSTLNIDVKSPKENYWSIKKYYKSDNRLKKTLINYYLKFKSDVLKDNALPNQIVKGKNDWLFLGNQYNNSLYNAFGNKLYSNQDTEVIINNLKYIKTHLATKNIPFYFVIAPDKNQIYPENLPYNFKKKETRSQKLLKEILTKTNINAFSLQKTLIANKLKSELYYKTDSHWNDYGGFVAYSKIMESINKSNYYRLETLSDYKVTKAKNHYGDLSRMLNSDKKVENIIFNRKNKLDIDTIQESATVKHYKNKSGTGKLLMYRDSFADALKPFLNHTFNEIIYIKGHILDKNLINSFKPDLVILEKIERNLIFLTIKKSPLE